MLFHVGLGMPTINRRQGGGSDLEEGEGQWRVTGGILRRVKGAYSRDEVICTCKMGLTFRTSVDFIPVEVSEILETLFGAISAFGGHGGVREYHYVSLDWITATQ